MCESGPGLAGLAAGASLPGMVEEYPARMPGTGLRVLADAEAAIEDRQQFRDRCTAVEQVTHIGEVALEQVQWYIGGHPLLSKCQVSLSSIRCAYECFVCQVAQILHGGNQLFKSSGSDEVLGEMIPQVGFIVRQIRPMREGVGIQQVCM